MTGVQFLGPLYSLPKPHNKMGQMEFHPYSPGNEPGNRVRMVKKENGKQQT